MEDAKTMFFSFVDSSQNCLFSFDIKSGYHHIDIFPPDQEFLGFPWFKDGFIHFYKFTVYLSAFPLALIYLPKSGGPSSLTGAFRLSE